MKLYIGFFEGNHWAVESEREKPVMPDIEKMSYLDVQMCMPNYIESLKDYSAYIDSLPRTYQCSDSLVRGLKPGDQLPPCEEGYEVKRLIDKNSVEYYWAEAYWKEYSLTNPDYRRIILVPVEAKQEQEETVEDKSLWELFIGFRDGKYMLQDCLQQVQRNRKRLIEYIYEFAWRYGRLYHIGDSDKILERIKEVFQLPEEMLLNYEPPQEQGEDELWLQLFDIAMDDDLDSEYRKNLIKVQFTITRKG